MLNRDDFRQIAASKAIINHLNDGEPNRLNFQKILNIFEFILTSAATIMFNKNGTPKTKLQLIGSIFSIIGFVRDLVRMINGEVKSTEPRRIDRRIAGKTVQAIDDAVERSRRVNKSLSDPNGKKGKND